MFFSLVLDSYGENKKEKEQQKFTKECGPLAFAYFEGISITEGGFPDISSNMGICDPQFFVFGVLVSCPPASSISLTFFGQVVGIFENWVLQQER